MIAESIQAETSPPVQPAAATFLLPPDQLSVAEATAAKGSAQDAYRVANHYLIAMNNVVEGKKWLLKAAQLGSVDAQYELGGYLLDMPKKHDEGLVWIQRAAKGGSEKAKHLLEILAEKESKSSKSK